MDLVNKYLNLSEAMFPGSPEYKRKFDSSFNPYDPEGKVKKALKLKPYGYRDKAGSDDEEPTQQPASKTRGRPKKVSEAMSAVDRIDARFKKLSGRSMGDAAKEHGAEVKRLQKEIDAQAAENERRKAAMKKEEADLDEATPTKQQVKQAIGITRDKRYAKGNVSGAVKAMDKLNPGLAQHPVVKRELQKQNEEFESIEELSKTTLASYAKKGVSDARFRQGIGKEFDAMSKRARRPSEKASAADLGRQYRAKAKGREAGVIKAIDRLAKEEVEQIDEVKVGDKVSFNYPIAAAGGTLVKKTGTVHQIDGDTVHVKVKSKYGVMTHKTKASDIIKEEVEIDEKCWDGYTARGMKKKDGRMVPNCVPNTEQTDIVSRYLNKASVHQEAVTYDSGFRKMSPVKDRFGNKVKNVAQHLARQGMQAAIKDLKKGPEAGKKQVN